MKKSVVDKFKEEFYLESKNAQYNLALDFCRRVSHTNSNVLLIGESGTGKEVAARYIHACSNRAGQKLVAVNCNAFTETLLESELFGHEQGAFTGASKSREGKFETANHGTLFLDEIGDLSISTQIKLLRTLETKQIERIGSNTPKTIDFQLITATNQDLPNKIRSREFREDFFYRISTIVIRIPPLRERKEDLPQLIDYFLKLAQKENNIHIHSIDSAAKHFLTSYDYPGNIRELKNVTEKMVVLSHNGVIGEETLPILYGIGSSESASNEYHGEFNSILPWKEFKAKSEKDYLSWVLIQLEGNVAEASRQLGISSRQLFNKIKEYEIR